MVEQINGGAGSELELPEIPACVEALHSTWRELRATQDGTTPLGWVEIAAWQNIMGVRLTAWEAATVLAMECAASGVFQEASVGK